jgi:arabinose-5-phosphate isomerase
MIAITKNAESTLGKAGDVVLELPKDREACPLGLAPTSSTTATLVLGDILTIGLIDRKGFSKEEFNVRHPGGKLGSILKRVGDLMHVGQSMPILDENSNMQAVLLEMTSKCLGCVGFVNQNGDLTGMLTDGDLRRCLSASILEEKAINLMTKSPRTVTKDMISAEALKIMHDKKITNLFVLEGTKPIGVIHIHDLLNNGVA